MRGGLDPGLRVGRSGEPGPRRAGRAALTEAAHGDQRDLVMAIARLAKRRSVVRPERIWFIT